MEQIDLLILERSAPDRFEKTIAAYQVLKATSLLDAGHLLAFLARCAHEEASGP
ncbi:hypothetical protein [Streptomyces canus]|uniref:hypothetical protein n=1 Tax=Streptomyces canus TaxID=58343 RepID=UPI002DD97FEE|nr:hypothetical protein [Streptomyces canus]WSD83290.1 hypothetical protein OG925_02735 [Streptomyces canus]